MRRKIKKVALVTGCAALGTVGSLALLPVLAPIEVAGAAVALSIYGGGLGAFAGEAEAIAKNIHDRLGKLNLYYSIN